ncbi:hypothetical protein ACO0LL_08965 [Undibacterium sp. TC4M20W]|uniref:hypothetical protein n=1 Tax=Undibacterium sp. TC4M20W TaxID=3413052 RepID=UPI003BEF7A07
MRLAIESECDGFNPEPEKIQERRFQALGSFRFFAQTYFPHYVKHSPATVHEYLFDRFQEVVDNQIGGLPLEDLRQVMAQGLTLLRPIEKLCCNCFLQKIKSILQQGDGDRLEKSLKCHRCSGKLVFRHYIDNK